MTRPTQFPSNGKRLFGVLHEPDGGRQRAGIVFLNAGPQNRVGPQRLYLNTARRFCEAGFTCLRIDLPGVGESEGPIPKNDIDFHQPADVRGAIDLLQAHEATPIVLLGLCSGARAAVHVACADPRVDAVICWSAPVLSAQPEMLANRLSQAGAHTLLRHWARRALQPRRWLRHLASHEARSEAATRLGRTLLALVRRSPRRKPMDFVDAVNALLSSPRGVFVAYGERDLLEIGEFEAHFGRTPRGPDRFLLVPGGDHTFTSLAARSRLISETLGWLAERYPRA
jgi:pimeloyl-ACP methyl ester carboxylesterase